MTAPPAQPDRSADRFLLLSEYESVSVRLSERRARRLAEAASRYVWVYPHPDPGFWTVKALHYVGTLVVDDMRILIRPKIRLENLFLMLEVGLPEHAWQKGLFDYYTDKDLLSAVVSFFARTVESTLARGLFHAYQERSEDLMTIRGRIDFGRQLARASLPLPVACRWEEFTADVAENRYLKAAIRRSRRVAGVPIADRQRLMRELVAMEEVSDLPVRGDGLDRITITRLNEHYRPALGLARLLLDNLTLVDQRGGTPAACFMVDMNDLFERFMTERLRRALSGRLAVEAQTWTHLDAGSRVGMRPDLVFRRPGSNAVVYAGDIKYKLTEEAFGNNADYYQLLAYTTALDLPEGVLIYCRSEVGRPAREITVRHAGKKLHVRAVDLAGTPAEVVEEIEHLADWIADRAAPARLALAV